MSTNLHLTDADTGQEVWLWQTPTMITYMCMSYAPDGTSDGGMEGIRRRYIEWVGGRADGRIWQSKEELAAFQQDIRRHVAEVMAVRRPIFEAW